MRVIIADESGYLGRKLSLELAQRGCDVTCIVPRLHVSPASVKNLHFLAWQVLESGTWHPNSIGAAYYFASGEPARTPDNARALRQFAVLARDGGTPNLVSVAPWTVKRATRFQAVLAGANIGVSEIRLSPVIGHGSPAFEMIRSVVERLPVIPCAGWLFGALEPVAIADVIEYLVDAPRRALDLVFVAGGSVETYTTMMAAYARSRKLPRLMPHLRIHRTLSLPLIAALSGLTRTELQTLAAAEGTAALDIDQQIRTLPTPADAAIRQALEQRQLPKIGERLEPEAKRTNYVIVRREGFIVGLWQTLIAAPCPDTFAVLESLGGKRGWLFADDLWQLRGWIDRALGGPGMSRGRVDAQHVVCGDTMDFWHVEKVKSGKLLRLRAEMKTPGEAWLDFECDPHNGTTLLRQTIYFQPRGVSGELYWAALYPFHVLLFDGMHRAIGLEARRRANKMRVEEMAYAENGTV